MNSLHYFKLGLFVLIGLALLVGGIVALGARSLFKKTVYAETYVDEAVTGIESGSAVKYRGVTIGQVKSVQFAAAKYAAAEKSRKRPSRKILVAMSLDASVVSKFGADVIARMVQDGLRARIMQAGITGPVYVGLDFFDPTVYPTPTIDWKPQGLYIPSVPSTTTQIRTAVERLALNLQDADLAGVVRHFDTLVETANTSIGQLNIPQVQEQAVALVSETRGTNARVKQLLNDPSIDAALRDLPTITGQLRTSLTRVDEVLHDKRLDQTLAGLSDAATNAGPATADARKLMGDLRTLVATEGDDLRSIVSELRATFANLNAAVEDLRANPSRLLLGRPPARIKPGE